jgi:predicted dienelactone hydrolase
VILFSHGFLGVADQSILLTEAWAREGFIVVAIDHADASSSGQKREKPVAIPNFVDARTWDESKFRDRRDDLVALLDYLLKLDRERGSFLHQHVNGQAVGAAGHSLGGYTVMGLIGGWPSWKDERIRVALLLSPYVMPYTHHKLLGTLKVPVMFQGGTLDWGITPFLQAAYDDLPGPKYYLVLQNATHFEWTGFLSVGKTTKETISKGNGKLMTDYSLGLFHQHLLRNVGVPILHSKAPGLSSYQFAGKR